MTESHRSVGPALELRVFATGSALSYELRLREPGPREARIQTYRQVEPKLPLADYLGGIRDRQTLPTIRRRC